MVSIPMGETDWFGKQSEPMRELYRKYDASRDRWIEEFAAAGERGEIVRKTNPANQIWLYCANFKYTEMMRRSLMLKDKKWQRTGN